MRSARNLLAMTVTEWAMPTVDNIRAEMARKRKTQGQLADVLGVSQAGASRRLKGQTPFDVNELFAIAHWLDVPVTALLADPPSRSTTDQYLRESVGLTLGSAPLNHAA